MLRSNKALIITGIVWACVIGLLGGFFPALRAARARFDSEFTRFACDLALQRIGA